MVTTTKGRIRSRGSRVWKLTPWAFLCKLCAYLSTRVLQGSYAHTCSINQGRKLSCLSSTQFNHTLNISNEAEKCRAKARRDMCSDVSLVFFLSFYYFFFSFSSSSPCRCCTNVCLGIFFNRRKFSFWLRQF